MDTPARIDFAGDRYVAFLRTVAFIGYDFTGATFAMQVRDRKDGGTVRATLGTVGVMPSVEGVGLFFGGTATVASHIATGRLTSVIYDYTNPDTGVNYVSSDSVVLSVLRIRIDETTMEAMPFAAEVGDDRLFYWDLHVTPSGGVKDKYAGGDFLLRAGVTA